MQLKTGSKQRLVVNEDSSMEQKTEQVYIVLGKENTFRLHLNESREGSAESKFGPTC